MTADLVAFLRERLHEDQIFAAEQPDSILVGAHLVRFSPHRMLAEVVAKRAIIADYEELITNGGPSNLATAEVLYAVLGTLARPYADNPDYRPEWAPTS